MGEEVRWDLTAEQHEFFTNTAKHKAFVSGIGAGKSTVGLLMALNEAITQPGSIGIVIAPTYSLIRDVIYTELDRWIVPQMIKEFSKFENKLSLNNGSVIRFRSAENARQIERLRGPSITWFWIDEATLLPKRAWAIMIGRLRQIGYNPKCWLTGTPRGYGWIYNIFIKNPIPNSFILSEVASRSNKYLSEDYFRSLEEQYTGQFREQELKGKFVAFEGLVYPGFTPSHVLPEGRIPAKGDKTAFGVDWGFKNPSCILSLVVKDGVVYVTDEFYQSRVNDNELTDIAIEMKAKGGTGVFHCDPSEPGSIEMFNIAGLEAKKADNRINEGIRAVTSLLESNRLYVCNTCTNLRNELGMYSYADSDKDTPLPIHNHACDALRYAIQGLNAVVEQPKPIRAPPMMFLDLRPRVSRKY
jgi:PBSX family phage terminase large subunit